MHIDTRFHGNETHVTIRLTTDREHALTDIEFLRLAKNQSQLKFAKTFPHFAVLPESVGGALPNGGCGVEHCPRDIVRVWFID
jgi:hypothetical protein